jgi:hypothetical protein
MAKTSLKPASSSNGSALGFEAALEPSAQQADSASRFEAAEYARSKALFFMSDRGADRLRDLSPSASIGARAGVGCLSDDPRSSNHSADGELIEAIIAARLVGRMVAFTGQIFMLVMIWRFSETKSVAE